MTSARLGFIKANVLKPRKNNMNLKSLFYTRTHLYSSSHSHIIHIVGNRSAIICSYTIHGNVNMR